MSLEEINWKEMPGDFEERIRWSAKNIPGYKESMEKYSPHLLELLD